MLTWNAVKGRVNFLGRTRKRPNSVSVWVSRNVSVVIVLAPIVSTWSLSSTSWSSTSVGTVVITIPYRVRTSYRVTWTAISTISTVEGSWWRSWYYRLRHIIRITITISSGRRSRWRCWRDWLRRYVRTSTITISSSSDSGSSRSCWYRLIYNICCC